MGRGRGKGKKNAFIAGHGEEEKLPVSSKRRGRPQKPLKDEMEEDEEQEEAQKIESDENATSDENTTSKAIDKGRKRKKAIQVKETSDPDHVDEVNESNGNVIKSVGFRPVGSRRKNKPCRAAEVGVKCR